MYANAMVSSLFGMSAWALIAILDAMLCGTFRRLGKAREEGKK